MDDDGQMIFGDLVGLKLPDIRLTGEEKPRKNLTQETCPDRESNPGPLRGKRACYHFLHSGGLQTQKPTLQFTMDWIGAVASHCFSHPILSLVSEQTLKDLKRSQGHQCGGEESGFG